jgi:hypothetical protein
VTRRLLPWLLVGVLAVGATGCGGDPTPVDPESVPHTHTGLPAGDGTQASYVGYTLADVKFPTKADVPGKLSFRIDTFKGTPLTSYVVDLTQKMHVYVVSKDLSIYRHVHPTMRADGTWTGNLTIPSEGTYRVVTEFTTRSGGNNVQLILGADKTVGAEAPEFPVPPASTSATSEGVTVSVVTKPTVGYEHQMELGLSIDGKPASLGTYLSVYAHVSAFNVKTGALVHMHPLGAPVTKDGKSVLDFHTGFEVPGDYRMFVQSRISGIVRTIPITVAVTGKPTPAP